MDSRTSGEHAQTDGCDTPDAAEFVRFCYRRRRVGWPELYDEMCAVAGRRQFRGWDVGELAERGVGFSLFAMPALARLVGRVIEEEQVATPRRGFSIGRLGGGRGAPGETSTAEEEIAPARASASGDGGSRGEPETTRDRDAQRERPTFVPLAAR